MLKGVPESMRNHHWHKQHEKRLAKDERRHKRGHIAWNPRAWTPEKIEQEYKLSQEQVRSKTAQQELWRWFINTKFIKWLRKYIDRYRERQYRGTK